MTKQEQLKVFTLGGLKILRGSQPVTGFISRKVEALLVYLAANPREHPREVLSELLWEDLPQSQSMSYLRTALSSLQKQLAPFLAVTRQSIAINPESDTWLDLNELDAALDAAEGKWQEHGAFTRNEAAILEEALSFYQGAFLQGFHVRGALGFENWMIATNDRLQARVIEALYRLGQHALARGLYNKGITQVTRGLGIDPLHEPMHRLLMLLFARSNQRSAALAQYETCRRILDEELGVEPEPETRALYEQIRDDKLVTAVKRMPPANLPALLTPFIDRPTELDQIIALLDKPECRLLTLVGQGGIGKTRLALEAARQQRADYQHGVYFLSFASLLAPDGIAQAIAIALRITFHGEGVPEQELLQFLRDKEMLLVLDNFEHLIQNAEVLSRILAHAPLVKLLVTSRERLNLHEEWLYTVEAMKIPPTSANGNAGHYASVQLFLQTAQRIQPEFDFEPNRNAVIEICQLVEGIPLAIEIAASWVRVLPCEQIGAEIRRGIDFLATTVRNVPPRHRSMRAVFESSWSLLSETEQRIFRQLSVFKDGFQQPAAEAVVGASLLTLSALVDKSLLSTVSGRYQIHELLRQFAESKLAEHEGEKADVLARHSDYYLGLLREIEPRLTHNLVDNAYTEVMREIENIWAAWEYTYAHDSADQIGGCLRPFYKLFDIQSRYKDGEAFFRRVAGRLNARIDGALDVIQARALALQADCLGALNRNPEAEELLLAVLPVFERNNASWEMQLAVRSLGRSAYARGDYERAHRYFEQARTLLSGMNEPTALATVLFRLSDIAAVRGDYQLAKDLLEESQPLLKAGNSAFSQMRFLITLGDINFKLGRFDDARANFYEAQALCEQLEARTSLAVVLVSLGRVAYALGDHERALSYFRQSADLFSEIHQPWGKAFALMHMGRAYSRRGELETAKRHLDTSLSVTEQIGGRSLMAIVLRQQGAVDLAQGDLSAARTKLLRALEIATELRTTPLVLDILVGFAALEADRGNTERAVQLASLAAQQPASEYETRSHAEQLLATLDQGTSPSRSYQTPLTLESAIAEIHAGD